MRRTITCVGRPRRFPMRVGSVAINGAFFETWPIALLCGRGVVLCTVGAPLPSQGSYRIYFPTTVYIICSTLALRHMGFKLKNHPRDGRIADRARIVSRNDSNVFPSSTDCGCIGTNLNMQHGYRKTVATAMWRQFLNTRS